ncbi:hypothetical protein RRG08_054065 [Elysia crispata]|uniref:Uncharacterized protein n=1 Tax=Elysia crispata TaxID=231223 RepID=A0AAE0ZCT6_9GAST|nr:hypothetical protein RRG08_054065 [Elysia crispata]
MKAWPCSLALIAVLTLNWMTSCVSTDVFCSNPALCANLECSPEAFTPVQAQPKSARFPSPPQPFCKGCLIMPGRQITLLISFWLLQVMTVSSSAARNPLARAFTRS